MSWLVFIATIFGFAAVGAILFYDDCSYDPVFDTLMGACVSGMIGAAAAFIISALFLDGRMPWDNQSQKAAVVSTAEANKASTEESAALPASTEGWLPVSEKVLLYSHRDKAMLSGYLSLAITANEHSITYSFAVPKDGGYTYDWITFTADDFKENKWKVIVQEKASVDPYLLDEHLVNKDQNGNIAQYSEEGTYTFVVPAGSVIYPGQR